MYIFFSTFFRKRKIQGIISRRTHTNAWTKFFSKFTRSHEAQKITRAWKSKIQSKIAFWNRDKSSGRGERHGLHDWSRANTNSHSARLLSLILPWRDSSICNVYTLCYSLALSKLDPLAALATRNFFPFASFVINFFFLTCTLLILVQSK